MAVLNSEPLLADIEYRDVIINGKNYGAEPVDWQAETAWFDALLNDQPTDSYVGCIVGFPVADGRAFYRIDALDPDVALTWIPYGDAYDIPDAHLRGLNREDLTRMVDASRAWKLLASR